MCDQTIALVQRELDRGLSQREVARRLRKSGRPIAVKTIRRVETGQLQATPAYARCACGGMVKTCRPCLKCELEAKRFQPAGRRHTSLLSIAP